MIGTTTFHSAEYQLNEVLASLGNVFEGNEFKRRVVLNLNRIREARRLKKAFNEKIVYYHLHNDLLPDAALLAELDKEYEERRRQIVWETFGTIWTGTFLQRFLGRGKSLPKFVLRPAVRHQT